MESALHACGQAGLEDFFFLFLVGESSIHSVFIFISN